VHRKLLLLVATAYTIALAIVSLITLNGVVPSLGSSFDDKIYHILAYLILAALWMLYVKPIKLEIRPLFVFGAAVCFGFMLEILQYLLNPNRTYDTLDVMANTIGAIIGTFIGLKIKVDKLK
jgi:VanZ family protein